MPSKLYDRGYHDTQNPRRYWTPGMDYERWLDLPEALQKANGMIDYHGPSPEGWHGFESIHRMICEALGMMPGSVLDVGCSTGVYLDHVVKAGVATYQGIDANPWSVSHPINPALRGQLHRCLIGDEPIPSDIGDRFDLVTSFDLLEHIFETDLDAVLAEIVKRADPYVALCICATHTTSPAEEWVAEKGEYEGPEHLDDTGKPIEWVRNLGAKTVPDDRMWQAVAGHITLQPPAWWWKRLDAAGIEVDFEAMIRFEILRRENLEFCFGCGRAVINPAQGNPFQFPGGKIDQVASWSPRCVVLGRVR